MTRKSFSRSHQVREELPDRAVIDIGSNTVRMVVYGGPLRSPITWMNEKVSARLGRDLAETGLIPEKAAENALSALRRYHILLEDLGIKDVQTVATAAARDAENGPEFLDRVRAIGLSPRLLQGEEEARSSAAGVISAFPGAQGVVADLGGGSLELIAIENDETHHGCSLPLGTLRLPGLRKDGMDSFKTAIHKAFESAGWAAAHPGPLYMVGGTWRALANYALRRLGSPIIDPHGFILSTEEIDKIAKKVARSEPEDLAAIEGVSSSRAASLPDAAAMLRIMLSELRPDAVVFSAWGLREGLLYEQLSPEAKAQDPLLAGVTHFTASRGGTITRAAMLAGWSTDIARNTNHNTERLRLASTMFGLALSRIEPNLRQRYALDWALHKRWIGLTVADRAQLAAALLASCGQTEIPEEITSISDKESLSAAIAWGLAVRLCRRMGGGTRSSMLGSALRLEEDCLRLWFEESHADLAGDSVRKDLKGLANWLEVDADIRIGQPEPR
ncbi:Ppx/GppA family phosphatase [Altericroceibacterium spongiae]|uniref:Ppx/GppA family phosphatase n=1 Tax=Altericroceibacterium spongiae TaxID=2320269 RepID=A0A420ER32_9SPHN|nr:Ppx/GppA family phosphatase [Altericroceibacterium spongiae]RKF23148.1 Ppx/GppA family phosphatase [Altericroceibacterium spongiae]